MSFFSKKKASSEPISEEDQYLQSVYNAICKHCKENGYLPPYKGIVDKTRMHVSAFDPMEGFKN